MTTTSSDGASGKSARGRRDLHIGFVEILFALAAAEIATTGHGAYSDPPIQSFADFREFLPQLAHLLLCLVIVGASWFAWGSSKHRARHVSVLSSLGFLEFVTDAVIVLLYFVLIKEVDARGEPSAKPEVWLLLVIFGLYLLWDVITCLESSERTWWNEWMKASFWAIVLLGGLLAMIAWAKPTALTEYRSVLYFDGFAFALVLWHRVRESPAGEWGDRTRTAVLLLLFAIMLLLALAIFV